MTIPQFDELGNKGQCPSCRGTNLSRDTNAPSYFGDGIYYCIDCGGIPGICFAHGREGVVYITSHPDYCPLCNETNASISTHSIIVRQSTNK